MESAVSRSADPLLRSSSAPLTSTHERANGKRAGTTDIGLTLVPVAIADVHVPESSDVMPRERSELASRVVNVVVATAALILVSPLFVVLAILVKATSPGPILYSQTRVGMDRRFRQRLADDRRTYDHGGVPFRMYKFRTMRVDAERGGRAIWASRGDPRVTPVGRLMRRLRLDELPQLYNVIRGQMNIVGPRPERPLIFAELREHIPEYPMRQRVRPGITGWAQINQAYDASVDDVRRKVRYDLEYMRRQGVLEDLRIMTMTIPAMVMRRLGW